ncbi:hypothetical protein GCM10008915_36680 [Bifidobacterium pullorum subsp. gallinarum]
MAEEENISYDATLNINDGLVNHFLGLLRHIDAGSLIHAIMDELIHIGRCSYAFGSEL